MRWPIPRSWRTWHLMVVFAIGSVVEYLGCRLREWSGDRIKQVWFPPEDDKEPAR